MLSPLMLKKKKNSRLELNALRFNTIAFRKIFSACPILHGDLVLISLAFDSEHYWFVAQCGAVLNHLGHCLYCLFCDVCLLAAACA